MCRTRWNTASISWCIRPPNISTATPTWSAAWRWSGANNELRERLTFLQNAVGAIQGPFDSFLALRGLKTLALRMERHCASALKIAQWLERHPKVRRVFYPGLASHPQHALAKKQMRAFGGMISAELHGHARRRQALPRTLPAVRAGRKPRRGRKPDRASRADDARLGAAPTCARRSASATRWCGSRSASRTPTISLPILRPRLDDRHGQKPAQRCSRQCGSDRSATLDRACDADHRAL